MPRGALGLTGRVVHLAHLVHVDERVEPGQVHPGERPADREPLSLEAGRCRGYREHGAVGYRGGVWLRNARQHQEVRGSDGGHVVSSGGESHQTLALRLQRWLIVQHSLRLAARMADPGLVVACEWRPQEGNTYG